MRWFSIWFFSCLPPMITLFITVYFDNIKGVNNAGLYYGLGMFGMAVGMIMVIKLGKQKNKEVKMQPMVNK